MEGRGCHDQRQRDCACALRVPVLLAGTYNADYGTADVTGVGAANAEMVARQKGQCEGF